MDKNLRTGLGYDIKHLKENKPEIYEKYRLLFAFFDIEEEPVIYQNELVQVSRKAAWEFFAEMNPQVVALAEGRMTGEEYYEWREKNVKIIPVK